jgi:hypothetical protein
VAGAGRGGRPMPCRSGHYVTPEVR